ncbi:MAG TPA: hypothetical protein VMJ10_26375 [Kofleriaceae bacterium]|nr:hypothetical protein [Kofleriaceae bacterium]
MVKQFLALALVAVSGCTADVAIDDDSDLANDPDLEAMAGDTMPETAAVDVDTVEPMPAVHADVACAHHRYLHVANFSFVAPPSQCVNGVCPNGCWGAQRRTSGFACDYDAGVPGDVAERDGGTTFASYNEIKPLNAHDNVAVARCEADSGHAPMRTYTVWNGAGWDSEGIPANIHFAEIYGPQDEATTELWPWYDGYRDRYAPLANISPNVDLSALDIKRAVARICTATRDGWLGLYYYNQAGDSMSDRKRQAIIEGMNYCTTH